MKSIEARELVPRSIADLPGVPGLVFISKVRSFGDDLMCLTISNPDFHSEIQEVFCRADEIVEAESGF